MSAPPPPQNQRPRARPNPFVSDTYRHRETRSFFAARWKNVGVAATLLGFVGGAFLYTINSVSKNDFDEFDSDGIRRVDFEESKVQKQ